MAKAVSVKTSFGRVTALLERCSENILGWNRHILRSGDLRYKEEK
jgi:hypothetical protein